MDNVTNFTHHPQMMQITSMVNPNFIVFGPFLYIIPTIALYIYLLYLIFDPKQRDRFTSSFYRIFAIKAFASVLCIVTFQLCFRLPVAPVAFCILKALPSEGFFPTIIYFLCCSSALVMFMTEGFLSFNRATTILLTFRHAEFWKIGMRVVYVSSIVIPCMIFWDAWFEDVIIIIDHDMNRYSWTGCKDGIISAEATEFYSFICLALLSAWNIFWNLYTLSYLVKRVMKNSKNSSNCLVDTKQFLISFVTFLIESSTMIVTVWLFTVSDNALDLACSPALYFLIDACMCLPAWLMVFMNTGIRQTLKEHCSEAVGSLRGDYSSHRMKIRISKSHSLSVQTNKF